ncbi:MAG TPA: pitrilysin family protein [Candidatus Limnocylindrales bacterium]|nr:pitrilysin family protein [Candidatus Limnocylindrales bacterium]
MSSVSRHVLDNGMIVLLKEVHSAPLISWWVLYRVGSRNEPTGLTGASHWVEHMLFKGTEAFPAGYLDKAIDREGGSWNAQTFLDYTAYHETMPADKIDLALRLEADRMTSAAFDPEEVDSERTVIISERQGAENSPLFWLGEEMSAAAFRVHGYHHEILGDMRDLETMTRDDLAGHYARHYMPNNAIAVAVGDFDSAEMLARIKAIYEAIPAGELPKVFARPEPPQQGERRVTVERPGGSAHVEVSYHAPAATDADWFALSVFNSVLTGPSSLGGGGIDNKTSRLYRALVETELATNVDGSLMPTIDPHLYGISATVRDGRTVDEVEAVILQEIERALAGDITPEEIARAKKQARALFAYSTERVTMQAFWLAFAENFSSFEWFEGYVEVLERVTLDEVLAAGRKYLRPQNRIVGRFVPTAPAEDDDFEPAEEEEYA